MAKSLNDLISSEDYFKELIITFPDLLKGVDYELGDHYNMERFADYTIKQIKTNNIVELKRCFDFQNEKIHLCPALEDAMVVSYCESLLLGDAHLIIHNFTQYMKPNLLKMYNDYKIYYNDLTRSNKRK